MTLVLQTRDVIVLRRGLYVKTPEALVLLLEELKELGYNIKDMRKDAHSLKYHTPQQMERQGLYLWYARLSYERYGKCDFCGDLVTVSGILVHGRTCEHCQQILYLDMTDGTIVQFRFNPENTSSLLAPTLCMKVHHWDVEEGILYFYNDPLNKGGWSVVHGEKATEYMNAHQNCWWVVEDANAGELLAVRFTLPWDSNLSSIERTDTYGGIINHTLVNVFKGVEYGEDDKLPFPESITIYETWHWAPLAQSPVLYEHVLGAAGHGSDKSWHYQDGTPFFKAADWEAMATFIEHFTMLDAAEFRRRSERFPKDGPGGIQAIANFCHDDSFTEDTPNVGNVLFVMGKMVEGKALTESEIQAAIHGLSDYRTSDFARHLGDEALAEDLKDLADDYDS